MLSGSFRGFCLRSQSRKLLTDKGILTVLSQALDSYKQSKATANFRTINSRTSLNWKGVPVAEAVGSMMRSLKITGCIVTVALACAHAVWAQQTPLAPALQNTSPVAGQPIPAQPITGSNTPGATARPSGATVAPDYVVGPGDSLEINVWKEPTVSGTLPVRPDGMISLSLVGDLQAAGLTPMRLSDDIALHLKKYLNDPVVTVTVLAVNSKHIFLLGEITKPGEIPLTPGLTPLQAIASSGGLTLYANAKHVYILRTAGGKQQKIPFDYKKAIKDGNLQGVTLVSGDTIVVP